MRTNFAIAGLLASLVARAEEVPDWSDDYVERVNQAMDFCDKDEGGTISYQEFIKCAKQIGEQEYDRIEREFVRYDLNDDSKVDFDELTLVMKRELGAQPISLSDDNFASIFSWIAEDDGDEMISWREFKSCWTPLYDSWDYRMLKSTFQNADFDQDGYLSFSEAFAEYEAQTKLDRKFAVVDENDDGKIDMSEWSNKLIFMAQTSNNAAIRERFGYHDENGDGVLERNELYHVIRDSQIRWQKFSILWSHLDPTGDGWTDVNEALDGMKEYVNPDITEYECEQFLKSYDRNYDGRVQRFEMWLAETDEWDKQREAEIKNDAYSKIFNSGWFTYDQNRDFNISWEELRYVRDVWEGEEASQDFWKHFKDTEEYVAGETMLYEEAFSVWSRNQDTKKDFDYKWQTADSDRDWQITINDIYAVVGVIPGLIESDIPDLWAEINTDNDGICYYNEACEAIINKYMCSEDYDFLRHYVEWKNDWYPGFGETDTDGDLKLSEAEIYEALGDDEKPYITEIFAFFDTDSDNYISMDEYLTRGWEYNKRKEQATEIWNKIDPEYRGVVYQYQLEEVAGELDWLPSDFFENMDTNNDGFVSAQEACKKAGGFTWECEALINEEEVEIEFDQERWEGFLVSWYRIDRDQDEIATEADLRAVRDSTITDAQVTDEFNYYDADGDGSVQLMEAWAVVQKLSIRHSDFEEWFWSLNTDGDEYLSSDELANDDRGIVDNTDGQGQFHRDDLCQMWFTDIPLQCVEMTFTEEDIAPEDFIKSWYGGMDLDFDEKISEDEFLSWAEEDDTFNWLSRYEIKTQVYDIMNPSGSEDATFAQGAALYVEVHENLSTLNSTWLALGFTEENKAEQFDNAYLESVWDSYTSQVDPFTDSANEWFYSLDTDEDGYVTYMDICQKLVGYAFCGDDHSEEGDSEESILYEWERTQLERNNIVHWYRIDKDQNEVASEADFRDARSTEWTDAQVTAEFNHLDVNGDLELTFDEFSHVRTEDKLNFLTWFRSLSNRDGDYYYMESWEHSYDDSGLVDFTNADSDNDYKLTEYEACPHFHHEYPSVCQDIYNMGEDLASEDFMYNWYLMDTDKDESLTFDDFYSKLSEIEYGKYAWMTEEEARLYIFDVYNSDNDEIVTFAEAKAGHEADEELKSPVWQIWYHINPSYNWIIDQSYVESTFDSMDENLKQGFTDAASFFQHIDLDSNGSVVQNELCTAITGLRHLCTNDYGHLYEFDWRVDYNVNRMVSYEEYTRAFAHRNNDHYYEPYWNEWLLVDASGATELSWSHINARKSIQNETIVTWNNTLATHGIQPVYQNTTIPVESAYEWFSSTDSALDRDGDGQVRYSEFCMTLLAVESACLSETELDIIHWDTNESGGIDFEEFKTIMQNEGNDMSEQYAQMYFDLYDLDNDGDITVNEVWDMSSQYQNLHYYNSTNWLYATQYLMDSNNDTHIDHDEFRQGMNVILTLLDQETLEDDDTVGTFYDLVFPPELEDNEYGPSAQETGLMVFMKDVLKRGIESYLADNGINQ